MASDMLEKMRIKEGDDEGTVLSKKISYILRHGAKQLGLHIDAEGFVAVDELLSSQLGLLDGLTTEALIKFVDESNQEKQRYEIREADETTGGHGWLIRATGKHTMQGFEKKAKAEKLPRASRAGVEPGVVGGGNRRIGSAQAALTEDEFMDRWRLDRFARARFQELPVAIRHVVMVQFRPGPKVDAADYPKVFVGFCKKFRGKGKVDEGKDRSGYESRPRGELRDRQKTRDSQWPLEATKSPEGNEATDGLGNKKGCVNAGTAGRHHLPLRVLDTGYDYDLGGVNYASPGSSPRSIDESPWSPALHSHNGRQLQELEAVQHCGGGNSMRLPPAAPPFVPSQQTMEGRVRSPPPPTHVAKVSFHPLGQHRGGFQCQQQMSQRCQQVLNPQQPLQRFGPLSTRPVDGCQQQLRQPQQQQQQQHQQLLHQQQPQQAVRQYHQAGQQQHQSQQFRQHQPPPYQQHHPQHQQQYQQQQLQQHQSPHYQQQQQQQQYQQNMFQPHHANQQYAAMHYQQHQHSAGYRDPYAMDAAASLHASCSGAAASHNCQEPRAAAMQQHADACEYYGDYSACGFYGSCAPDNNSMGGHASIGGGGGFCGDNRESKEMYRDPNAMCASGTLQGGCGESVGYPGCCPEGCRGSYDMTSQYYEDYSLCGYYEPGLSAACGIECQGARYGEE